MQGRVTGVGKQTQGSPLALEHIASAERRRGAGRIARPSSLFALTNVNPKSYVSAMRGG
jgi:hypothetical protein